MLLALCTKGREEGRKEGRIAPLHAEFNDLKYCQFRRSLLKRFYPSGIRNSLNVEDASAKDNFCAETY